MSPDIRSVLGVTPTRDSGKSTIFWAICNLAEMVTPVARKERAMRPKTWFADQVSSDLSRYRVWKRPQAG
jgi:hypothetical protein